MMLIKKLIQTSSVVAISSVLLSACGGSGGDKKDKDAGKDDPVQNTKVTLQGTAMKGIMKEATVQVFSIQNGQPSSTPIKTVSTDDKGAYQFESSHSGPILVKVSGNDNAMMTCDIAEGCDSNNDGTKNIDFGVDYEIPSNFTLEAVSHVEANKTATINVTPLTNLAAKRAKDVGISVDSIASANSQVANVFQVTGDITKIPTIDITKADQVKSADKASQKNALMAASLFAAAKAEGKSLNDLADDFVQQGGQLVKKQGDTAAITLEEIYAKAQGLFAKDALKDSSIKTDIQNAVNEVAKAQPGDKTDSKPSDDVLSSGMKKVQAMVQDLRNIGVSTQLENKANDFSDQFSIADQLLSDDLTKVSESLGKAVDAIKETKDKIDFSETAKTYVINVDGTDVNVTIDKDVFTVKEQVNGVSIDLTSNIPKDKWQRDENEGQAGCPSGSVLPKDKGGSSTNPTSPDTEIVECHSGTVNYNALIEISGSAKNENVEMMIKDGSIVELAKFNMEYKNVTKKVGYDREEDDNSNVKIEKAKLDLNATIKQLKDVSGVVKLNGKKQDTSSSETTRTTKAGTMLEGRLTFELTGVETTETEKEQQKNDNCIEMFDRQTDKKGQFCGYTQDDTDTYKMQFNKLAISFNGKAASSVTDNTNVNFSMEVEPNGVEMPDDVTYKYRSGMFTPYLSLADVIKGIDTKYPASKEGDNLSQQDRALLESFRANPSEKESEIYAFAKKVSVEVLDSNNRSYRWFSDRNNTGGVNETSAKWVDAKFSFGTDLTLEGIDNDSKISFSGKRTGYRTAKADVTIAFDDKRYTIAAPEFKVVEDKENNKDTLTTQITITNQNSVKAVLDYSGVEKDNEGTETLTGQINYDGTKYADIERENNMTLIRYTNGQVESLE